jgi:hypothetical protein
MMGMRLLSASVAPDIDCAETSPMSATTRRKLMSSTTRFVTRLGFV